ncbi:chromate transporter [Lederbergia citrea]|uniref:chromate transporter n=1 Tax=Lederbergia citrea TaxID=2833581 RepID=UPI001BC9FE52|nr:chromate transporter [Lederbergia citrea]MBS4204983.1 chromate transporter [Lederbergia citrea]
MIYWQIFLAFFIPGILGYGGGPSSIPLIENEVVDTYGWLTVHQFSEMLALGNALPGPIATKMAGYIGYEQAGIPGALVALFATIAPSMILMIALLGLLLKYKHSPQVKKMTQLVRPAIAVLLGIMTVNFFVNSISMEGAGYFHTIVIGVASLLLLQKWKIHPAYVIGGALLYGAVFL